MEEKESTKFIFDLLIPCAKFAKIADLSKEHPLVSQKQVGRPVLDKWSEFVSSESVDLYEKKRN